MAQYISKSTLVAEIDKLENKLYYEPENFKDVGAKMALDSLKSSLDTLEVKEVDLEKEYKDFVEEDPVYNKLVNGIVGKAIAKHFFELGLKAQHDNWKVENLWKPADGDDLPDIDREVIVLTQPYPLGENEYTVSFAHRPNPNGWDGKSITTGNIEHYTPKTYGKGGWNIPNVKYWLDCSMPKEIEL